MLVTHKRVTRGARIWLKQRDESLLQTAAATVVTFFGLHALKPISAADVQKLRASTEHHAIPCFMDAAILRRRMKSHGTRQAKEARRYNCLGRVSGFFELRRLVNDRR